MGITSVSIKVDTVVTQGEGLPPTKSYNPWLINHMMSCDKLGTFYLLFYKTNYQHTWWVVINADGLSPIKSYDTFCKWSREVTRQIKNISSPFLQNLWTQKLQGSMFRVRESRLPSHITSWSQDHVVMKNSDEDSAFYSNSRATKTGWDETFCET